MTGYQVRIPKRTNELACGLAKIADNHVGEVLEDAVDLFANQLTMIEKGYELVYKHPETNEQVKVILPGFEKYKKKS